MSTHTSKPNAAAILSEDSRTKIDAWIAKYPEDQKQSAVMGALTVVQEFNGGWLTTELMDAVADYLDMPPIAVYEVATFYSMYELEPVGENKLCICTNISCMLRGSDEIVEHLNKKLGIQLGETTEDNKFTLKEVECLGACGGAPMMQVEDKYHENLTPDKIDKIIEQLQN
ncbi:MAG TPA: NADH-quinone oxidoreductase subunit NuoE [Thioploca sp.]|nr:NADH-quinone oxidoreductase subunit NuoE [Thioploca sp.]